MDDPGTVTGLARATIEGLGPAYADLGEHPCPGDTAAELLLYPAGPLKDAVVWLEGVEAGEALPAVGARVTARGCTLEPRVQLAPLGTQLTAAAVGEMGRTLRLIRFDGYRDLGSIELSAESPEGTRRLRQQGLIHLRDDAFPGARGWLWVMEHPYHAVTDAAGAFQIDQVPPSPKESHYTLHIWHEAHPGKAQEIRVPAGGQATVELVLGPDEEP